MELTDGQMDGRTDEHETDASISKMHVAKHVVSLDGLWLDDAEKEVA